MGSTYVYVLSDALHIALHYAVRRSHCISRAARLSVSELHIRLRMSKADLKRLEGAKRSDWPRLHVQRRYRDLMHSRDAKMHSRDGKLRSSAMFDLLQLVLVAK